MRIRAGANFAAEPSAEYKRTHAVRFGKLLRVIGAGFVSRDAAWGPARASDTYAAFKLKKGRWEAVQLRVTCAGVERLTPEGPYLCVYGALLMLVWYIVVRRFMHWVGATHVPIPPALSSPMDPHGTSLMLQTWQGF